MTEKKDAPALKLVEPVDDPNWNAFLYGPPKAGKTVGAASAPKPLLYINAERPNATRLAHRLHDFDEVQVKTVQEMTDVMTVLRAGTKYKTVVFDPISKLYGSLVRELSNDSMSPSLPTYGDAGTYVERFCLGLLDLPVNTILVAHEILWEDGDAVERLPYHGSNSNVSMGLKLMSEVDVIGYCGVKKEEDGLSYVAQLFNGAGRRGGDRFNALGRSAELDLEKWDQLIRQAETGVEEQQPKAA